MTITPRPPMRAVAIGAGAAVALIGSFLLGTAQSGSAATGASGHSAMTLVTSSGSIGKITVTGNGTVTGTPNQLVLSMGVQVNDSTVSSALSRANQATSKVIAALTKDGVTKANIQTSGLSIQPNYHGSGQAPVGYGVSEQLTATLTDLSKAGTQIQDAATAGGNLTTVDDVSLNLTDTGTLLKQARARAVHDAQAKAAQFAGALGEKVDGVISVSDQSSQGPVFAEPSAAFKSAGSAVPVSPGAQQVSVQITIVYAIG